MAADNNEFHFPNPGDLPDGIDIDTLRLAATISGRIYQDAATTTFDFQKDLDDILEANNKKFPNLEVQFFYKELHALAFETPLNRPILTAIITDKENPDTLILGWRGTHNIGDMYKDAFGITPVDINGKDGDLRGSNDDVFIQKAVYKVLETQFNVSSKGRSTGKGKDLIKLVTTGNKVPGKEGSPIKRIIFTGHSLGGMLAQGAHYILQNGSNSKEFGELSKAIQEHDVELYTLAFSAVMSLSSTNDTIKINNMINVVYSDDIFPQMYGNTEYQHAFLDNLADGEKGDKQDGFGKVGVDVAWKGLNHYINLNTPIFKTYKHAGKIFHYESKDAVPKIYTNDTFTARKKPVHKTITADMAFSQFHNGTVMERNELGLTWWPKEQP